MWFKILKSNVCMKCWKRTEGKGFWTDHKSTANKNPKSKKDPMEGAKKYCKKCAPKGSYHITRNYSNRGGR